MHLSYGILRGLFDGTLNSVIVISDKTSCLINS